MADATITEYSDFYSEWIGLEDGTLLEIGDPNASYWVKIGNADPIDIWKA